MKTTQDTQKSAPKKSPKARKYAELGHGSAGPILVQPIFETRSFKMRISTDGLACFIKAAMT